MNKLRLFRDDSSSAPSLVWCATLTLAILTLPLPCLAQSPTWAKTYGGGGGEGAGDVRQTPDGGFLAAGWTKSFGASQGVWSDMWLVRLDALGNIVWQRAYGGSGREEIMKLHPTPDGGYIGIGLSGSFGASQHAPLVLKFDANGNVQWQKTYLSSGRDWGFDIVPTRDGGYVIPGYTDPCACGGLVRATLVKVKATGDIDWERIYSGGSGQNGLVSVQQTPDNGYIAAGITSSFGAGGSFDLLVMKFDANGSIQWAKTYGGSGTDAAGTIQLTANGGYIVAGSTDSFGAGGSDAWLLKLNADGSVAWQKAYGTSADEGANYVEQTSDGGYVASGSTTSGALTGTDLWVFKVDATGNLIWQRRYDSGAPSDTATAHQTSDGGYIVAGFSDGGCPLCNRAPLPQKFTILKLASDGSIDPSCPAGVGTSTTAVVQNTNATVQNAPLVASGFNASANPTNVTVTNTSASVNTFCAGSFVRPTITAISPTSGTQGQTITNFTANGTNFDLNATLSFGGAGITVNSYNSRTATQIVASISIAGNAGTGARDVTITNPGGQQATLGGAFTVILAPPPVVLPDLSITGVRPVQVVYGADLILGKNTAFEVIVHVDNPNLLPSSPIPIAVNFENVWYPASFTKDKFRVTGVGFEARVFINPNPPNPRIRPTSVGTHSVIAKVNLDPLISIPESNRTNNEHVSTVQVNQGVSLNLLFVPIPTCSLPPCPYGPLQEQPQTTVDEGSKFVSATYPLSEEGLSPKLSRNYLGSPLALIGMALDIRRIGAWARLDAPTSKEKAIGIVPQNYFQYHVPFLPGTLGITINAGCCNAGLVAEGAWTAVAHELGHLEGLQVWPEKEEYQLAPNGIGNLTTGFWVAGNKPVTVSYCFMGLEDVHQKLEDLARWVDIQHYTQLFENLPSKDPEVLLLTALLRKEGTVDLGPWYDIPNGLASEALPGDYAVRILNAGGQSLAEITFPVSFTMQADPHGAQPVDVVPIVMTIPYPQNAAAVEVLRRGQVLSRVSPISKVLTDAIAAIPDFGFVRNGEQLRNALLNKAEAIEHMLNVGANKGAAKDLVRDLRGKIQLWLVDGYMKAVPDQLEKNEVLFVIDRTLERISNLRN